MLSVLSLSFLALASVRAEVASVTPIQKVISLLGDMLEKAKAEKNDEEVKYSAYAQWCANQDRIKKKEIAEGNESIEKLNAEILKATADIDGLTARVQELDEDIGRWKKDQSSARTIREKEEADYQATVQDYGESLDALERAIAVLKEQSGDKAQADAFVQSLLQMRKIPIKTKKALTAFLQQGEDPAATYVAPEANAYEFQSGGVVDMLEKLRQQFRKQKTDLEAEELNTVHAYEAIQQKLTDEIENAEAEIKRRSKIQAEREQDKADYEKSLAQVTLDRDEDQKFLDDTTALCTSKASDYEKRQAVRADEIKAIQEAMDILGSDAVSGAGDTHLPALMQMKKKALAFVQLRGEQTNPLQERVAEFLAGRAKDANSQLLSLVAQKVSEDPFKKVKKMIKDLIVKLMEEATAEAEQKGWCDTELTTNKQTRDSKSADVANLKSEVEQLTAEIAQLTQDISDLQAAIKELDEAVAKASSDRQAAKEKNAATIKEAKEAQEAVSQALAVLKEFYAKAAESTALAQQKAAEDQPETFDKPYQGNQAGGQGVLDFLQVIAADFSRLESETTTDEQTEQEEYEKLMFESKKDKALKENSIGHKTEKITSQKSALASTKEELKTVQEELDAAMAYYEKLKPTCVDTGITYEERVKRREAEIQSLKEALKILSGESI